VSAAWLEQRERGNLAAMRLMTWLTLTLGYRFGRALLYPICLYFWLFSPAARRASRDFLRSRLRSPAGHPRRVPSLSCFRKHLARPDRNPGGQRRRISGPAAWHRGARVAARDNRGCLLLGSHLGSFEILRVIGESRGHLAVNLVMHEGNARQMSRWLHGLAPELAKRIIAPGQPETLLRVRECLERGELVAMLGDRVFGEERTVTCEFLGARARFPAGPILAAALLRVPVVTFFCLYRGARSYDAHFELLVEQIEAGRGMRDEAVARCVSRYANRLEVHARAAPENWFNFYDFWRP
jgi:predicted LPLAT superfamily acyltransferase